MNDIFNILNYLVSFALLVVLGIFCFDRLKNKKKSSLTEESTQNKPKGDFEVGYVEDFLDFEKIYKNMIIREHGTKFTMVISCSGINFDLMSESEKRMVEEAFIELLNFIQFPIQIYVQTRKVDLKDSLKVYSAKISSIENQLRVLVDKHNNLKTQKPVDEEELGKVVYEIERKRNLFEYAEDLKKYIERLSINSNVLQYKYYIALTYRIEELGLMTNFNENEITNMAYSDLYTRCHSIINALTGCDIEAKIMDSNSLAELLYMAFNRDDGELFRLKDNLDSGFHRLYSTTETITGPEIKKEEQDEIAVQLVSFNENFELDEFSKEILIESAEEDISA